MPDASMSNEALRVDRYSRIQCLVESRGTAKEVGFASLDLQSARCVIGQFSDTLSFAGLCRNVLLLEPELIILSASGNFDASQEPIYLVLRETFRTVPIALLPRKHADASSGESIIQSLCIPGETEAVLRVVSRRFYLLAAVSSLFSHISGCTNEPFRPGSIKFVPSGCEGTVMLGTSPDVPVTSLDYFSILNLELGSRGYAI